MRAQFAVEHLMVVALGIMLIIPVVHIFYSYSTGQSDEIILKQLSSIGNKIVDTSETIYFMGKPAKITIEEYFPDKINTIKIINGEEFVFYIGGRNSSVPFLSNVPLKGPYYGSTAQDCNETDVVYGACYTSGMKQITLLAGDENVSIIIQ